MKTILKISVLELENLFCQKRNWTFAAGYVLAAAFICLSGHFRQSYFSDVESVPLILIVFVAPYFLVVSLVSALSPVFAGDREQNTDQIPAACLVGRKGRNIARTLAAVLFSVISCGFAGAVSAAAASMCGLFDGNLPVESAWADLEALAFPSWTVSQFFLFSLACLLSGCVILAVFILCISSSAANVITAVSLSVSFVLFEFIFHRFSFPVIIKEYNIWMFFKPYSFFKMSIWSFSPTINLILMSAAFLLVCIPAVCWIVQKRERH